MALQNGKSIKKREQKGKNLSKTEIQENYLMQRTLFELCAKFTIKVCTQKNLIKMRIKRI